MPKLSAAAKTKTASTKAKPNRAKSAPVASDFPAIEQGGAAPTVEVFKQAILRHLVSTLARVPAAATPHDWWVATSLTVRDHLHERLIATQDRYIADNARRLYYLSMEYLVGRLFESNLHATGLADVARAALAELCVDLLQQNEEHYSEVLVGFLELSVDSRGSRERGLACLETRTMVRVRNLLRRQTRSFLLVVDNWLV